jgi:ribonuclease P protein component
MWMKVEPKTLPSPAQAAFSVSKKGFRHAVSRNLIKRRMREAYRKKKQYLYDFLVSENIYIVLVFIFRDNLIPRYQSFEKLIVRIRKSLNNC